MSVLIIFASVEGQTRKITNAVADQVRASGLDVTLFDTSDKTAPVSFDGVDKVIMAAPVHERRHPKHFELFLSANKSALAARQTLLLSVSLNAAFPERQGEAQDYATEMKMRVDLKPDAELLVAGAVRGDSYDYYESQVLQHVVLAGKDIDPNARELEFTDWAALTAAVNQFIGQES